MKRLNNDGKSTPAFNENLKRGEGAGEAIDSTVITEDVGA